MSRGGSRKVAKSLQESVLIAFDFIWKVLESDRNYPANELYHGEVYSFYEIIWILKISLHLFYWTRSYIPS